MTCVSVYSVVKEPSARSTGRTTNLGGAERDRTADPLVANQVLSQLSYSPLPCIVTNPALAPRGTGCTPSCSTSRMAEARWWA